MKRILITGQNSYIGNSFINWIKNESEKYQIDSISLRNNDWKNADFSIYDVVYHVVGLAHVRETKENSGLYYKINRDLAYDVARKSKNDGVKHFILLSSMSVYGLDTGIITKDTIPNPKSSYGKSKYEAEQLISDLVDRTFKLAILRPPMVYGEGCKGNYVKLSKLAKITPVFPDIKNKRSMIFIDNLSEYVKCIIDFKMEGIFLPQNSEYVNTSELVKLIAECNGKVIRTTKLINPFLKLCNKSPYYNKVFGDLIYQYPISNENIKKCKFIDLKCSVRRTENFDENNTDTK